MGVSEELIEKPTLDDPWDYATLRDAYLELAAQYEQLFRSCSVRDRLMVDIETCLTRERDGYKRGTEILQAQFDEAMAGAEKAAALAQEAQRERDDARRTHEADVNALSAALRETIGERDEARKALHEIVTNGEWISTEWCVSKAVYDLAYEVDLRVISTGEG